MPSSLAVGGAALGIGSGIAGGFLGGGGPGNAFEFKSPGFTGKFKVSRGETRAKLFRRPGSSAFILGERIPRLAGDVAGFRTGLATPGFGVRSRAVENRRTAAIGNLRENLARRRLLGSSFGEDALARAEREFAQEAGEAALQEIQDNVALAQAEAQLLGVGLQQELSELGVVIGGGQNFAALAQDSTNAAAAALSALGELGGTLAGFGLGQIDFGGGAQPGETAGVPVNVSTLGRLPIAFG